MSTNVTAFIKRITVSTVAELKAGSTALERGQWGFASSEEIAVLRDLEGAYHELMVTAAAVELMDDLILSHIPVANYASLPTDDLPGSMRLVTSEAAIYRYAASGWDKFPLLTPYSAFLGQGPVVVTVGPALNEPDVTVATISHRDDTGNRHLPKTGPVTDLFPIVINGRTYPVVAVGNTAWLGEDLGWDVLGSGNTYRPGGFTDAEWAEARLYNYDEMLALNSAVPGWHVATWGEWRASFKSPYPTSFGGASRGLFSGNVPSYQTQDEQLHPSYKSAWAGKAQTTMSAAYGTGELKIKPRYSGTPYDNTYQPYWSGNEVGVQHFTYAGLPTTQYNGYPGYWHPEYPSKPVDRYYYLKHTHPMTRVGRQTYGWVTSQSMETEIPSPYNPYNPPGYSGPQSNYNPRELCYVRLVRDSDVTFYSDGKPLKATNLVRSEMWQKLNTDDFIQGLTSRKLTASEYTALTSGVSTAIHTHINDNKELAEITEYTYVHNLGYAPDVSFISSDGRRPWLEVSFADMNTIVIYCNQEFTGTMRLV